MAENNERNNRRWEAPAKTNAYQRTSSVVFIPSTARCEQSKIRGLRLYQCILQDEHHGTHIGTTPEGTLLWE